MILQIRREMLDRYFPTNIKQEYSPITTTQLSIKKCCSYAGCCLTDNRISSKNVIFAENTKQGRKDPATMDWIHDDIETNLCFQLYSEQQYA